MKMENDEEDVDVIKTPEVSSPIRRVIHAVHMNYQYIGSLICDVGSKIQQTRLGVAHSSQTQPIDNLSEEFDQRDAKISKQKNRILAMKRKIQQKSHELHEAKDALQAAQDKIERLAERESKLRNIVLENTGTQDAYDGDFLKLYGCLRQKLLAVARNELICLDTEQFLYPSSCPTTTVQFYRALNSAVKISDRHYLLQAYLFDMINRRILTARIFGLGQALNKKTGQNFTCDDLETSLQRIEDLMLQENVPDEAIADWRLPIMKCIECINDEYTDHSLTTKWMYSSLIPILSKSHKDIEHFKAILKNDITQAGVTAYKLRLLMRKSKSVYWTQTLPPDTILNDENSNLAEVYGVENDKQQGNEVAYTLFGALCKHAAFRGDEPVVLEKAQVIVKAHRRGMNRYSMR